MQGNFPSEWASSWSPALTNLVISGCGMTGPVPPEFNFTQVIRVDLSNNSLTGSFEPLANSSTLQALELSNNQLSGSLLWLQQAPALRYARLSGNAGITGPLNGTTPGSPGICIILEAAVETGQGRRCAVRLACLPLPDIKHAYAMAAS